MTGNEFTKFIEDTQEVFGLKLKPKQINLWFKAFESIDYDLAQKMVELYYTKYTEAKTKKPSPVDLMKVKKWAFSVLGRNVDTETGEIKGCSYCSGGFVIVKKFFVDFFREEVFARRCYCDKGSRLAHNIKQINEDTITDDFDIIKTSPLTIRHKHAFRYSSGERLGLLDDTKQWQDYLKKCEKLREERGNVKL